MKKKLPVGIENFTEFIKEDFYFVDKTGFISELLQHWGKGRKKTFVKSIWDSSR